MRAFWWVESAFCDLEDLDDMEELVVPWEIEWANVYFYGSSLPETKESAPEIPFPTRVVVDDGPQFISRGVVFQPSN